MNLFQIVHQRPNCTLRRKRYYWVGRFGIVIRGIAIIVTDSGSKRRSGCIVVIVVRVIGKRGIVDIVLIGVSLNEGIID